MASSIGVRLFDPFRIWLILCLAIGALLLSSAYSLWHLSEKETQRLADLEKDILVRARINDLEKGDLRAFVEGIGKGYNELFITIVSDGQKFEIGVPSRWQKCSKEQITQTSKSSQLEFILCRPSHSPAIQLSVVVAIFFIVIAISFFILKSLEKSSLRSLSKFIKSEGVEIDESQGLVGILRRINIIVSDLGKAKKRSLELAKAEAIADMATQVAHDIQSPLAALDVIMENADQFPEKRRRLLQQSVGRIREIAEDLLSRKNGTEQNQNNVKLLSIIEQIVAEKKIEFKANTQIEILVKNSLDPECQPYLTSADAINCKRVVSNLLNNAIQAVAPHGKVEATISSTDTGHISIKISDSGKGIPHEVIPHLGKRGNSFGKKNGSGLGLFSAKSFANSLGGDLKISSILGQGTDVVLEMPQISFH